jgi:hypothetical protein
MAFPPSRSMDWAASAPYLSGEATAAAVRVDEVGAAVALAAISSPNARALDNSLLDRCIMVWQSTGGACGEYALLRYDVLGGKYLTWERC